MELRPPVTFAIPTTWEGARYDFDFIYNFTKYLHCIHRFNTFVTFARPQARFRPKFLVVRTLEQALVEDFNVPTIVWGLERTAKLRNNIGLNNLVFVQFNNTKDPILDVVDYTLEGIHFISMLFFYKAENNTPPTVDEIHSFFVWCWEKNMLNVALTFQIVIKKPDGPPDIRNHVFSYSPFPNLTVSNLTEEVLKGGGSYAVEWVNNVKGYTFKALFHHQPPWTFLVPKNANCKKLIECPKTISGTTGRLYTEYIKFIGGTMNIVANYNVTLLQTVSDIHHAIIKKEIDIGVFPLSDLLLNPELFEGSYPIGQTNVCIIVPVQTEMSRRHYLVHSFQTPTWALFILTYVALLILQFFVGCGLTPFSRNPVKICGHALLSTASVMFNTVPTTGLFQGDFFGYKLVHLAILIMAFVLSNTYIASLTSLLTAVPLVNQIDTIDEFLASGLEILGTYDDREFYFKTNNLPSELESRLRIVDERTVISHAYSLNTSYAYVVTAPAWPILNYKQQHLSQPLFRLPSKELCSKNFFLRMALQWDSPFLNNLQIFSMITQESGLLLKWDDMTLNEIRRLRFSKPPPNDVQLWKPLRLEHFLPAIKCVLAIWILATACFVGEVSWYRFIKNWSSQKKKKKVKIQKTKRAVRKRAGKYYKKPTRIDNNRIMYKDERVLGTRPLNTLHIQH